MTSLKILVIDDEKDILTIVKASLETQEGFVVKCVISGKDALIEAPKFQPDLILLDVLMPGMDGVETLKALQKIPSLAKVPVVVLTAFSNSKKNVELLAMGIVEVIIKPFDPWTLSSQIQSIFERYNRENPNLEK